MACLNVCLAWPSYTHREMDGHFHVEVKGLAEWQGETVCYLPTVQDEIFVIAVPGIRLAEEVVEIVKADPSEPDDVTHARLPAVAASGVVVGEGAAFALQFEVSAGQPKPGLLKIEEHVAREVELSSPLTLALWHADLEEVGWPLAVVHL